MNDKDPGAAWLGIAVLLMAIVAGICLYYIYMAYL